MKQRATVLAVVLLLASAAVAGPKPPPQVELVTKLYTEFAFEAVVEEPENEGALLIEQPREVLVRYLEPTLAGLLLADRQCVVKTKEVCRLDFAPLWGNQDPIGGAAKITQGPLADLVFVQLRFGTSTVRLTYKLANGQNGWRIKDIEYGDRGASLRRILGGPQ